jgi:hypothetical protein
MFAPWEKIDRREAVYLNFDQAFDQATECASCAA